MSTKRNPFGRIAGFSTVAIGSLAAGWTAGYNSRFVTVSDKELATYSRPYALDEAVKEPAFPGFDARLEQGDTTKVRPEPATPPEGSAETQVAQQERDLTGLSEALALYKSGSLAQGDEAAAAAQDKTVKTTLEWTALHSFPHEAGFDRLQAFMQAHPAWPALDWLKKRSEEALYGDRKSSALIKTYFGSAMPVTAAGKLALARALIDDGRTGEAGDLIRAVWRDCDINPQLESKIKAEFGAYLGKADHKYRALRLLYKGQNGAAFRAAALAGPDILALAKAHAAVVAEARSDKLLAKVPPPLHSDPAFIFAQIHKLRHADKIRAATEIMLSAPRESRDLVDGDAWWTERRLLARKVLDLNDPRTAYQICAGHAAVSREGRIEAEFHAGWIALRFLNDPERAATHFDTVAALAVTPVSKARAAYWQARAAEASSRTESTAKARSFYEQAAVYQTSYYGQLARAKLGLTTLPVRTIATEASGDDRNEAIRVVELLFAAGEKDLAAPLVIEAAGHLADEAQVAALASLVAKQRDAYLSLSTGKIIGQRGIPVDKLAFPDYGVPAYEPLENSVAPSIVYSIARQESAFKPSVTSTAGAKGLMQMILSTAKRTAQRARVAFDPKRLVTDAAYNARLAARHLGELMAEQKGSYVLTFAAYNAGGKNVQEWIEAYGDPRKPGVDPVDWIERIPFTETRNYVQRVIENLNVYRAQFGETGPEPIETILSAQAKL
ncbi:MAG TPA: lytic transglycosylase domain-containing protein [Methylocella sp.]|nr:lytic transglycosylase domain-containing protein [Methylocella sp.]